MMPNLFWTDAISPTTLRYHDKDLEREVRQYANANGPNTTIQQYQAMVCARRATIVALGSLVEGSMNVFMAARAFAPRYWQPHDTPLSLRRMRYSITMALILPVVRGFPYSCWALDRRRFTNWLVPICVFTRFTCIVVYALHNMAHAQARPCGDDACALQ